MQSIAATIILTMTLWTVSGCCPPGRAPSMSGRSRPSTTTRRAPCGVSVVHLGDLGHALSAEQLAAIGPVDGVLVPVGGVYTVDARGAKAACDAIGPKWIVPMHYHHAPYGLPDIAGVEDFLALWPAEQVHSLPGAGLDTETAPEGVLLPKF